jgi:hypothetical protein
MELSLRLGLRCTRRFLHGAQVSSGASFLLHRPESAGLAGHCSDYPWEFDLR